MNEVPLKWFLKSFKESCENNERFCFILGSGASVESGIPTGLTLAQRWIDELNDLYTVEEIEELKSKLKIKRQFEIEIELNFQEYLSHAKQSKESEKKISDLIEMGLKDPEISKFFILKKGVLFFKRNVFLILGEK